MADVASFELQIQRSQSCLPGRKLPSIPNDSLSKTNQNFKRFKVPNSTQILMKEYSIFQEYLLLKKAQITGVYVIPSAKSSYIWHGLLLLKHGYYKGGSFKFKLIIPQSILDNECPTVLFTPPIYHPLINKVTGVLNIKWSFHPWIKNIHKLWHVVAYIKKIFVHVSLIDPENLEAAKEFETDLNTFKRKIKLTIEECNVKTLRDNDVDDDDNNGEGPSCHDNDDDCHSFKFSDMTDEMYSEAKYLVGKVANEGQDKCIERQISEE